MLVRDTYVISKDCRSIQIQSALCVSYYFTNCFFLFIVKFHFSSNFDISAAKIGQFISKTNSLLKENVN